MRRLSSISLTLVLVVACQRARSGEVATASRSPAPSPEVATAAGAPRFAVPQEVPFIAPPPLGSSSELLVGRVGERSVAVVADVDTESLLAFDIADGTKLAEVRLVGRPGHVVAFERGLAVAVRGASVVVLVSFETQGDALSFRARGEIATDPDPLALASRDERLWVLAASSASVTRFDGAAHTRAVSTHVARDPRAILSLADGGVMIAHATGGVATVVDADGNKRDRSINIEREELRGMSGHPVHVSIPVSQSYALASYRDAVLVPTVTSSSANSGGYGGGDTKVAMNLDSLAFREQKGATKLSLVTYNDYNANRHGHHTCTLPRGVLVRAGESEAWVACAGEGEIQTHGLHPIGGYLVATPGKAILVDRGVSALGYAHEREALVAYSPITRAVTVLAKGDGTERRRIELPASPLPQDVLLGREIFHRTDAAISNEKKACASCHPDGGDDGLVWSTPDGRRRTMPLAGTLAGPVFGWEGQSKSLQAHVTNTIKKNIGGKGIDEGETKALLAYLQSMKLPPSVAVANVAREQERGRAIFRAPEVACASCHKPEEAFRDMNVHNAGAGKMRTPTLVGIGRRKRLFHDGRFGSLEELLARTSGTMGSTKQLDAEDRSALLAYLRTL